MKNFLYISTVLTLFFTVGCRRMTEVPVVESKPMDIPLIKVSKDELTLNPLEGKWYYHGEVYNGYSLKYHSNGKLAEQLGFYNGKRQGIAKRWSENIVSSKQDLVIAKNYILRSRQDSNLRFQRESDFESDALTTRPRLLVNILWLNVTECFVG